MKILAFFFAATLGAAIITITASDGSTSTVTIPDAAVAAFVKPRGPVQAKIPAKTLAQASHDILVLFAKQANRQSSTLKADQEKLAKDQSDLDAQVK
jgi:hypothetical protein